VKPTLVVALILVILSPFGTPAQKKAGDQAKIICYPSPHPKLALQVIPRYPQKAKLSGIEGRVSLHCIVGADGSVLEMEVIRGEEPFVQAAKTAVAQWKYQPVQLNGVAVESDTTVDIIFQLPRQKSKESDSPGARSSPHE
jgi:TonB family protein